MPVFSNVLSTNDKRALGDRAVAMITKQKLLDVPFCEQQYAQLPQILDIYSAVVLWDLLCQIIIYIQK